jgi:hypothetical protein
MGRNYYAQNLMLRPKALRVRKRITDLIAKPLYVLADIYLAATLNSPTYIQPEHLYLNYGVIVQYHCEAV